MSGSAISANAYQPSDFRQHSNQHTTNSNQYTSTISNFFPNQYPYPIYPHTPTNKRTHDPAPRHKTTHQHPPPHTDSLPHRPKRKHPSYSTNSRRSSNAPSHPNPPYSNSSHTNSHRNSDSSTATTYTSTHTHPYSNSPQHTKSIPKPRFCRHPTRTRPKQSIHGLQ